MYINQRETAACEAWKRRCKFFRRVQNSRRRRGPFDLPSQTVFIFFHHFFPMFFSSFQFSPCVQSRSVPYCCRRAPRRKPHRRNPTLKPTFTTESTPVQSGHPERRFVCAETPRCRAHRLLFWFYARGADKTTTNDSDSGRQPSWSDGTRPGQGDGGGGKTDKTLT